MAYSDFTLDKAIDNLGVQVIETSQLFEGAKDVNPSVSFLNYFERESSLSGNSEKARSEKYIAPILDEVFTTKPRKFTLFSGENFDVDKELELRGIADFLVCLSTTQAVIQAPVITIAESKKNDPVEGLGQCVAELVGASIFNQRKNMKIEKLFSVSTNGNEWMFGEYSTATKIFAYHPEKYYRNNLPRIIGILSFMRDEALRMYDNKVNN